MKRRSIILFSIILSVMALGIATGLYFLYRDAPAKVTEVREKPWETMEEETAETADSLESKPVETKKNAVEENTDGPFSVLNSSTGKMNSLQRKDGQLSLSDENGKVLWSIPFDTPLCSMAGTIDYYANGKLQFLFISDDEIRLFDRRGKEVTEVRNRLEKPVKIGPAIYDFSGARRYNILTLNKDNTIDMYNLKGKKPAKWEGITVKEPIRNLPRYIVRKGKSYWWLSTEKNCYLYAFMGGAPLRTFPADTSPADVTF